MDKIIIASLASKFLGIYALIQSIPLISSISQLIAFAKDDPLLSFRLIIASIIPALLMATAGMILIIFSTKIAKKMLPEEQAQTKGSFSTKDIQSIAFSVVGLLMIVLTFPKIIQIIGNVHALKAAGDERNVSELISNTWSYAAATGFQFIIGIFLFIGSELLSSVWHFIVKRLRYEKNITSA